VVTAALSPARADERKTSPEISRSAVVQEKAIDFTEVAKAVDAWFAVDRDYQPGDLIRQSQVAGALEAVEVAGWKVPNGSVLVTRALADNSFLARELSTPAGRKFMRKIAQQPGGYSRLDRLSSIDRGERIVRDLVRAKNGAEFIAYLATTRGGRNLGHMLAGAKHGADLNKPTGRIYTASDLLFALETEFQAQHADASKR
jgi:hypothetical protein